MGFSEKSQKSEGGLLESDIIINNNNNSNRKWVIAGIALRAPLKPIYTTTVSVDHHHKAKEQDKEEEEEEEEEECYSTTTPTGEEAKVPTTLTCPPAPRKRKPSLKCNNYRGTREFFTPPDLETVFIRHVERAS